MKSSNSTCGLTRGISSQPLSGTRNAATIVIGAKAGLKACATRSPVRLLPLLALVIAWPLATPVQSFHHYEAARMSMACAYAIDAYGPDADALPRIVDGAFDEVDRIDRLMSHYKPDSPLSQINREAAQHPVAIDPELFAFIAEAMRYGRDSGGAFDITVGPLMKAWGFFGGEGRVPPAPELAAASPPRTSSSIPRHKPSRSTCRASNWISAASRKATQSIASSRC